MSHISDPPIFSSTCIHRPTCTCLCVSSRGLLFGGLSGGLLSGRFRPGWFLSVPLLSEYINYNRKLNITFNFRFNMYEIFLKCDVTCSWTLSSCHKLSHLLGPPPPRA